MGFVGSNLVNFSPLMAGGHFEFGENSKILPYACFDVQVVCPYQILSKSDDRESFAEPKCHFELKIWQN